MFNKIQNSSLVAFIVCSVFVFIAELLSLISLKTGDAASAILNDFSNALIVLEPYIFCFFVTDYFTTQAKRVSAFWCVVCLFLFHTAYGGEMSFIAGLITALLFVYVFERFNKALCIILASLFAVIIGLLLRYISDYVGDAMMSIAYAVSGKGKLSAILFGMISTAFSLFDSDNFCNLFFYKSYGGTIVSGDEVITGIKDLVSSGYDGALIADYLSGHYFVIFALLGIVFALSDELKGSQKICLIAVSVLSLLSGNISLLILFLFLEGWHLFLAVLLIGALSFFTASLLDIRAPYLLNGGFIELLFNFDKPVYIFAGGLVFVAIGYFTAKYLLLKFGISDILNTYIPTKLNKLVKSLGGIVNIVKVTDEAVEVRNPKLVNNFDIDCEIRENLVQISNDNLENLREYIN